MLPDRERNMWIASSSGVYRIKEGILSPPPFENLPAMIFDIFPLLSYFISLLSITFFFRFLVKTPGNSINKTFSPLHSPIEGV
jgi:hypothetical protein